MAGLSDAKNDDVFELDPKRERDDDPGTLTPAGAECNGVFIGVEDDGVFRPDDPKI